MTDPSSVPPPSPMRPEPTGTHAHSPMPMNQRSRSAHSNTSPIRLNPSNDSGGEGDLLGIVHRPTQPPLDLPTMGMTRPSDASAATSSGDDDTAPSSTANSNAQGEDDPDGLGQFIDGARMGVTVGEDPVDEPPVYSVEGPVNDEEDDDIYQGQVRPLIYGYLHKLGRNGKWQRRWFETDGDSLTYYKTDKRIKLLATLDLIKVGTIAVQYSDSSQCTFAIQVADRPYSLRADSRATCKDWVITLNRVKEAKLQMGHVKLVKRDFMSPQDLLDKPVDNDLSARVVLSANRVRTRAVKTDETMTSWEQLIDGAENPAEGVEVFDTPFVQGAAAARWEKPRTVMTRIKRKLLKWARSIACQNPTDDVIETHVRSPQMQALRQPASLATEEEEEVVNDGFASTREIS